MSRRSRNLRRARRAAAPQKSNKLKQVQDLARQLREQDPKLGWREALSKASDQLNS